MITPSFSLTATERVLPSMALDFTTASLDSRVTFTRSGNTATVVNSSGLVTPINADLPRFDFDPVTLACKGLLIEEAKTNLLTYSDDIGNGAWIPAGVTVSTNSIASPDGTVNADRLVETATTGEHKVYRGLVSTIGTTYTWSVFAKKGERNWIYLDTADGVDIYTFFDLNSGVVGNVGAGVTAKIENYGNGWYRCIATKTAVNASIFFQFGLSTANGVFSYSGDITKGAFFYGAQLEVGAFATSYIPTVASQVTRTADVATMTGTNFSSWFNASEGAFVASAVLSRQAAIYQTTIFCASDNTTANLINCFYRVSGSLGLIVVTASANQLDQVPLGLTTGNTIVNIGVAYKVNNAVSYANGTSQSTVTTLTVPTVTQLQLGLSVGGTYLNGIIRNLRFYKQRILNTEGQAFSK
jgi:hypothetical protein